VPLTTQQDSDISAEVARHHHLVSPREVRTLREYGVLEVTGGGGRGKAAEYVPGTAEVVAAIELAKLDPTYRRKLHRAVLIAWVRDAPIGTDGLRWAYREHFKAEERTSRNILDGKRVEDGEIDLRFGPEFHRAIAAAHLGLQPNPADLSTFEKSSGPTLRAIFWNSSTPDLLPVPTSKTTLGLAEQRSDGTWRVLEMGKELWEAMELRPKAEIAHTAPRGELDAARGPLRAMDQASGFQPSDFVIAGGVPGAIPWFRRWHGDNWWHRTDRPT
jgi:hypothetical protein